MPPEDPAAPVRLERTALVALDAREATVRVEGTRVAGSRVPGKAMLVIEYEGRRHRFPQLRSSRRRRSSEDGWEAEFTIPAWLEPHLHESAHVVLGDTALPLPPGDAGGEEVASAGRGAGRSGEATAGGGEAAASAATAGLRNLLGELRELDAELAAWQDELRDR